MQRTSVPSRARRARNLAFSLTVLLLGAAFYAHNVRADEGCGGQADFLVQSDPLAATVRPADCARLFDGSAEFAWPRASADSFVVKITYPDGRVATMPTRTNWLSWEAPLPPGDYTWTVTALGAKGATSNARRFTIDRASSSS